MAVLVKEYGALTGVLGLVLYGLLRLSYVYFYLRLRATPEELGYSYSRLLSESVAGAVELILLGAVVVVAALTLLYYFPRVVLAQLIRRPRPPIRDVVRELSRVPVRRVATRSLAISVAIVLLTLPVLAWWQSGLALQGQKVRNVYFVGVPYLPVLAVQAVPAEVAWKTGDTGKPLPLSGRNCLMYLGQANGTTIFYDVGTGESVRLPSVDITVTLRPTFFVPDSCG